MENIDDIKQTKRDKSALVLKKMHEALDNLEALEEEGKEIYVNGASEEMIKYCKIAKNKVKVKGG